jgi:hypothetical protein
MILPQGTKAPDANLLDGVDSTDFLKTTDVQSFANIKVGEVNVDADSVSDTLEIAAGDHINISPDPSTDKITISIAQDTDHKFVSEQQITEWNSKQDALGYTPINKTGDTMTGELQAPSINIGGKFKFVYDPNTNSLVLEVNSN